MSTYDDFEPRRPSTPSLLWPLLLFVLLAGWLAWHFWPHGASQADLDATPRPVTARGNLAEDEQATIELFKKVSPSVVHVTNVAERRSVFSLNVQQVPRGTGSGFVWDSNGLIVTNYHVVQGADAVQVILGDKDRTTFETRSWIPYPDKDLALLWIKDAPKGKLQPIEIGTSNDLQVGQKAYAIGNPFGLDQTLTTGIVSALNREIESVTNQPIRGVIQTNAAINPGNSGGPLLDSAGRLIGVNTAILSPSGTFAGIGFAIPVDEVNRIVPRMVAKLKKSDPEKHEKIHPPRLGLQIAGKQLAERMGVDQGVLAVRAVPGSPAAKAGIQGTQDSAAGPAKLGDIIVAFDGEEIKTANDLYSHLEQHQVGDTVTVTVLRDKERLDLKVTLGSGE